MDDLEKKIVVLSERQLAIQRDVAKLLEYVDELRDDGRFVTKTEFWPIKSLVYGFTGILLFQWVLRLVLIVLDVNLPIPLLP